VYPAGSVLKIQCKCGATMDFRTHHMCMVVMASERTKGFSTSGLHFGFNWVGSSRIFDGVDSAFLLPCLVN
jgi:hypothetical protein